ncbi:uncharacterized protein SCHCODRAFT_02135751 [Schizophyllum commune H4-8]|uniref:uncharacterized protein n=1 Tax=Schizophyllum commune (strain H4-8 / FGSC 9210) TaxID=578458 RepID=UPI00215E154F|nr:uncharacterized protein SCHCODRAFT_02135751 [Schizophyllum commune H4-8]KAI5884854.1 hypothetical protein SCHCODRAFT_02135751 [Schizophyllum commune H4-8]
MLASSALASPRSESYPKPQSRHPWPKTNGACREKYNAPPDHKSRNVRQSSCLKTKSTHQPRPKAQVFLHTAARNWEPSRTNVFPTKRPPHDRRTKRITSKPSSASAHISLTARRIHPPRRRPSFSYRGKNVYGPRCKTTFDRRTTRTSLLYSLEDLDQCWPDLPLCPRALDPENANWATCRRRRQARQGIAHRFCSQSSKQDARSTRPEQVLAGRRTSAAMTRFRCKITASPILSTCTADLDLHS